MKIKIYLHNIQYFQVASNAYLKTMELVSKQLSMYVYTFIVESDVLFYLNDSSLKQG